MQAATRQSAFFFRDEVAAVLESTLTETEAARICQPILLVEGEESWRLGPLSGQISSRSAQLFPTARFAMVDNANHMMPVQAPDAVTRLISHFIQQHQPGFSMTTSPAG
jgi:pimeloyl-ACP methyl ester carboxylesterase